MKHPLLNVPRIRSILPLTAASLILSSWAPTASARLFLDPGDSDAVLITSASGADTMQQFPLPIISYFGAGPFIIGAISENGNIYYGSSPTDDYSPTPIGYSGYNQISPLWQDFKPSATGSVSVKWNGTFDYLAITWLDMELDDSDFAGLTGSFQAIIFENNITLNGVDFQAGDIIFSYDTLDFFASGKEFNIGMQSNIGATAFAPDNPVGWYMQDVTGPFPYGDNEYLLFRPNGSAYTSSIEVMPIPEPSTVAALLSGSLLIGWRALRRRRG